MVYYKKQYDKGSQQRKLKEGMWVWLHNTTKKVGLSPKLMNNWEELPYKITEFLSELVVEIQQFNAKKKKVVHINKYKKSWEISCIGKKRR